MQKLFVSAYQYLYGGTKKEAVKSYKDNGDAYRKTVIETFLDNAKRTFNND